MSLYLVQHGKCLSKTENPAQPLSPEGTREVNRIAEVAKNYRINVSSIEHSVKERAKQTAEILAGALDPAAGVVEKTGLKPMDDVQAVASRLHSGENKMLVGHLPFMEKLTSYLTTGSVGKPVFKFQNGGIVCLDRERDDDALFIKWALMPEIK